jgi:hypothetical protein
MRSQMKSKVKPVLNMNEKVRLRVENEYISWRSKKIKNVLKGDNGKNKMK